MVINKSKWDTSGGDGAQTFAVAVHHPSLNFHERDISCRAV
jgi:hypothetical protein